MLVFNEIIAGLPVASVQATHKIGTVIGPIIDPRNLSLPALYVENRINSNPLVLFTSDIRSAGRQGIIIDHDEQLMERDGLVRLEEIIALDFELVGKRVETEDGQRLGKVGRYAFDMLSWQIMKLYVVQPLAKNLSSTGLIISRQQVVKVTDNRVVVKSTAIKTDAGFSWRKLLFGTSKPVLNPDTTQFEK